MRIQTGLAIGYAANAVKRLGLASDWLLSDPEMHPPLHRKKKAHIEVSAALNEAERLVAELKDLEAELRSER